MEEEIKTTFLEQQEIQKRALRKEYYEANKEKLRTAKKRKEAIEKTKLCIKKGLPEFLAEYISFYYDGTIHLTFIDETDLLGFLVYTKFKTEFDKDLYTGVQQHSK